MTSDEAPRWRYERGEGRYKHRWANDYAGFEPSGKGPVGKCPSSITEALAQEILNAGIAFHASDRDEYPSRIYATHQGVIYEAVPTVPGSTYHGYPWRGDLPGRAPLPRRIMRYLEEQAESSGHLREHKQWLKRYG